MVFEGHVADCAWPSLCVPLKVRCLLEEVKEFSITVDRTEADDSSVDYDGGVTWRKTGSAVGDRSGGRGACRVSGSAES